VKTIGKILEERNKHFDPNVFNIQQGQTVATVCRHLAQKNVGTVCVFADGRFVGVFGERDVVRRVIAEGKDPEKVLVQHVMTTNLLVAHPEEEFQACLERMQHAKVRHLPVVDDGHFLGMISIRDLFDEEYKEQEYRLQALTDYVYQQPPAFADRPGVSL